MKCKCGNEMYGHYPTCTMCGRTPKVTADTTIEWIEPSILSKVRELLEEQQHMLCVINAVTVFHRHHNTIPKKRLDDLANFQIDYEHKLAEIKSLL